MSPMLMMLSRKVRRVPLDWQHLTDERGHHVPLLGGDHATEAAGWDRERAKWDRGEFPDYATESSRQMTYAEWAGDRPEPKDYMPALPLDAELGICMYEEVTEGTPISSVYPDTAEGRQAMADYLAANPQGISGGMTADDWLQVIGGYSATKDVHTNEIDVL